MATSNASGQVTQINAYDDYGIPQGKNAAGAVYAGGTATSSFGRYGYTGQAWIPEIGLYHYKARAYSPTLGRFMQTDPIGYGDGVNLYAYVGGDPVNGRDPSGLACIPIPNQTGLGGSNTPGQGVNCNGSTTPAVTITTTPPTLPCPDPCITVTGAPTPPPPPPPPPGAVGVAFVSTGFSGSPAPAGFGTGAGLGFSPTPNRNQESRGQQKPMPKPKPARPSGLCGLSKTASGAGSILGHIATVSGGVALIPNPLTPELLGLAAFTGTVGGVLSLGGAVGEYFTCN